MVLALTGPNGERARVAGNPIKFTGELEPDHHYPPLLGADNRLILSRLLGLTDEVSTGSRAKAHSATNAKHWPCVKLRRTVGRAER
jgi:crotonobetainyl-CoA:carnitine CoA-transferase CaiB-like acyl-CoA transferase